ncbi:Glycosyltransferase involved in cell wall bisynthesis [Salinimicrobium catena]|uniref:Glycosyltransferase involved in cell wall bisynthesis n=1 Tax=Salinimicrobium catena TaxID=390640 RepID=A0A1H5LL18_9FLAO|nr:glycosyltransferase family 4 protein [Salinimicrobium catena]SDL11311.1 Glycosyltransferase involved in cell wall bisynthesis [Salinimicrobium catena]SEE77742.1 Glycosyltransferase involved in cell wall bisynthesis [Salinimicrobium catena]
MNKLIRVTTVPLSLEKLLEGQLNFMQDHYRVTAVASDEKKLKKLGETIKVDTFSVEMTREITPDKDLKAVWRLYRFFKKEKPLIVHTHTPKAGIAGMLAAKMAGVPIRLHTVAGLPLLEAKGMTRKILEVVEKLTYASATRVYPNSQKIHQFLVQEKFAPADKLKVIGKGSSNGIDTAHFDPAIFTEEASREQRKSLGIPEEDVVVVFVGRLVKDKGINELVEAFEPLNQMHPQTSLLLVGPFEQELDPVKETTLQKIKSHSKIFEVGFQDDVRPFFACSDVLAFPSYREGFPNVVMQAGAMGLPAIVTDINGCNEIIEEDKNGTLIPVRDKNALLKAMKELVANDFKREKLSRLSRITIKENYERKGVWEAILNEYRELEKEYEKNVIPQTT